MRTRTWCVVVSLLSCSVPTAGQTVLSEQDALARLIDLIARAAVAPKRRVPTRPTLGSKRRRLAAKAQRGAVKRLRGRTEGDAD